MDWAVLWVTLFTVTLGFTVFVNISKTSPSSENQAPSSQKLFPTEFGHSETPAGRRIGNRTKRLPNAIIIGVKKGGTRALLEYLRLHPKVRATGPEIHFFDRYYSRGLPWYRQQMPLVNKDEIVIEKTPAYFVKRDVPRRIHQMDPYIKLIVVLRDPVTRAISDYTQSFSKGKTTKSFDSMAINEVNGRVESRWNAIRIGDYQKHLQKWLPYFSLNQIHFVNGRELIHAPVQTMKQVEIFLSLPPHISSRDFNWNHSKGFPCVKRTSNRKSTPLPNQPRNPSSMSTSNGNNHKNQLTILVEGNNGGSGYKCLGKTKGRPHPHVSKRTLFKLYDYFEPYNQLLYRMIGGSGRQQFNWTYSKAKHDHDF